MTRRPGTPPFWRRRSPSPGPVGDRTRSRLRPSPPTLRLSPEATSDRRLRIPTFFRTPGVGKPSLLRSPFARRSSSTPQSYEDFERSRRNRSDTDHPLPDYVNQTRSLHNLHHSHSNRSRYNAENGHQTRGCQGSGVVATTGNES